MSSLLYYYNLVSQTFAPTLSLKMDDIHALIAKEERKFKMMQGQFLGSFTLFSLQHKLINTLYSLLNLLNQPAAQLENMSHQLRKIAALSQEISHELSKADRLQRSAYEQQLEEIKYQELVAKTLRPELRDEEEEDKLESRPDINIRNRHRPRLY